MTRKTTVDMMDRVREIREEKIPVREREAAELKEQVVEEYDDPLNIPDELDQKWSNLKEAVETLQGEAQTLEYYAEEWGGSEFTIQELTVGGMGIIQDDVAEASDVGQGGTPKQGYARQRSIEVALEDRPPEAPDATEMPSAVGDWLFQCIEEFNATGEVNLGNSSLRSELIEEKNREK